ncbi:Store-operated calcium entry-associated regulatory factor, partial [Cladochytrium tenue]
MPRQQSKADPTISPRRWRRRGTTAKVVAALLAAAATAAALLHDVPLSVAAAPSKVLLRDVNVLTLHSGRMTKGRRSAPVPQLRCVGGDACTDAAANIDTVQCVNKGFDGSDYQWECRADLDEQYRFGRTEVTCEGYSRPDDQYVLAGSCGVEYTLHYTDKGRRRRREREGRINH